MFYTISFDCIKGSNFIRKHTFEKCLKRVVKEEKISTVFTFTTVSPFLIVKKGFNDETREYDDNTFITDLKC